MQNRLRNSLLNDDTLSKPIAWQVSATGVPDWSISLARAKRTFVTYCGYSCESNRDSWLKEITISYNIIENPAHVHDLHATILHSLGIDHKKLTYQFQGRRFRLTDVQGNVVRDVLS